MSSINAQELASKIIKSLSPVLKEYIRQQVKAQVNSVLNERKIDESLGLESPVLTKLVETAPQTTVSSAPTIDTSTFISLFDGEPTSGVNTSEPPRLSENGVPLTFDDFLKTGTAQVQQDVDPVTEVMNNAKKAMQEAVSVNPKKVMDSAISADYSKFL